MKIFIIGAPGSGKGVIAKHLAQRADVWHLNYRSIIRSAQQNREIDGSFLRAIKHNTPFAPLKAFSVLRAYIENNNAQEFVLDGYPKTIEEATLLSSYFFQEKSENNITFFIDTDRKTTESRLKNRLVCPVCSYLIYQPKESILDIKCADCHETLIKRSDDNDNDIKSRVDRFLENKEGIINELAKISKIYKINGSNSVATVIGDIMETLFGKNNTTLAERGAMLLMEQIGLNIADPNMIGTPSRIVKVFKELTNGQSDNSSAVIRKELSTLFPTHYKGMIILDTIKCVSLCSHHLLPVLYDISFGYVPTNKSIGFSKIIKVINLLAAKPILQEDFTQEIVDTFDYVLKPKGIMVIVRGKHTCMSLRGEKSGNDNVTSAIRGVFKNDEKTREEFLSLTRVK